MLQGSEGKLLSCRFKTSLISHGRETWTEAASAASRLNQSSPAFFSCCTSTAPRNVPLLLQTFSPASSALSGGYKTRVCTFTRQNGAVVSAWLGRLSGLVLVPLCERVERIDLLTQVCQILLVSVRSASFQLISIELCAY